MTITPNQHKQFTILTRQWETDATNNVDINRRTDQLTELMAVMSIANLDRHMFAVQASRAASALTNDLDPSGAINQTVRILHHLAKKYPARPRLVRRQVDPAKTMFITYHTDGSCEPNPGPGGYAVIRDLKPHLVGCERLSTNNRMEGMAIIEALRDADGQPCVIHTDSQLWINIVTKWAKGWERKGWKKSNGEIKNLELVKQAHELYLGSRARLEWVRGHNGNEGNEMADLWASVAREQRLTRMPAKLIRRKPQ